MNASLFKQSPRANQFRKSWSTILIMTALVLVMINVLTYSFNVTVDLTKNNRFSVNDGTIDVFKRFKNPLQATYVVSQKRPAHLADLQRDVVNRLSKIADAVGKERFDFVAKRDVIVIENTAEAEGKMAAKGITPHTVSSDGVPFRYFSTLELRYVDSDPIHIEIQDTHKFEYELVLRAVKLLSKPNQPATVEETIKKLKKKHTLIYQYGAPKSTITDEQKQLAVDIQNTLTRMVATHDPEGDHVEFTSIDVAYAGLKKKDIGDQINTSFQSKLIIHSGGTELDMIPWIDEAGEGLERLVAARLWYLDNAAQLIGVLYPDRSDLVDADKFIYYSRRLSTEARVQNLVERLGYRSAKVRVNGDQGINRDIAALVVVRPSALSERTRYDIEAYLANGGKVLLWHGDWHVPLFDSATRVDLKTEEAKPLDEYWYTHKGGANRSLTAIRSEGGLGETLKKYGISPMPGFLLGERTTLPYRVYGPQLHTPERNFGPPIQYPGTLQLVPYSVPRDERPALAANIEALALRGASPLLIDEKKTKELGLRVEPLLSAPNDSMLLKVPATASRVMLNYGLSRADSLDEVVVRNPEDPWKVKDLSLEPVDGAPVAVRIRGQFPFDENEAPPSFGGEETTAPGGAFAKAPGELIVVSSPDALETVDFQGWKSGELGLVGGADRLAETSARAMLSNALDAFVYGEELIDVRRSLMPTPRRIAPWSESDRKFWTGVNVLVLPGIALIAFLAFTLWRRLRREEYERKVGLRAE